MAITRSIARCRGQPSPEANSRCQDLVLKDDPLTSRQEITGDLREITTKPQVSALIAIHIA